MILKKISYKHTCTKKIHADLVLQRKKYHAYTYAVKKTNSKLYMKGFSTKKIMSLPYHPHKLNGLQGVVLPIMAYTERLRPKGVPFSLVRYIKG